MKVFISWSGDQSKAIAIELQQWIQEIIQAAEPWMSTDIEKGKKWLDELNCQLETSKVAILCLTKSALLSPWMHYEAGAIAKSKDALVCNLLLGVEPEEVTFPLAQFQVTRATKDEMRDLVGSINSAIGNNGIRSIPEKILDRVFERNWDRFATSLELKLRIPDSSEIGGTDVLIGVTLLSKPNVAWTITEPVPAVLGSVSSTTKKQPPAMLAMMAGQFEKKNLAKLIRNGFVEVANDCYNLTEFGRTEIEFIAERIRQFQKDVADGQVASGET